MARPPPAAGSSSRCRTGGRAGCRSACPASHGSAPASHSPFWPAIGYGFTCRPSAGVSLRSTPPRRAVHRGEAHPGAGRVALGDVGGEVARGPATGSCRRSGPGRRSRARAERRSRRARSLRSTGSVAGSRASRRTASRASDRPSARPMARRSTGVPSLERQVQLLAGGLEHVEAGAGVLEEGLGVGQHRPGRAQRAHARDLHGRASGRSTRPARRARWPSRRASCRRSPRASRARSWAAPSSAARAPGAADEALGSACAGR